jgi:His-Xaa-Ser system protein HxsD
MGENIIIENDQAILKVNPKAYDIEVVYSAAYVFLDKAYIILDGDKEKEIIVKIKSKKSEDLEILANEFFNELINYSDYKKRAENTKEIREMILQRSLITNDPSILNNMDEDEFDEETKKLLEELENEDDEEFDDLEGIAIPWEEKYGKESEEEKDE